MALTSLINHSVQTQGPGSNTSMLMPKLKYRFRVTLLGFGIEASTELTKQVIDVTRPKVSFEEMEIPIYNSKVYLAGKYTWEPITLNVRDDASGNITRLVGQQVQKQFDFMEQSSARSGQDYKFTTRIEILDGGNGTLNAANALETFELYGCFLQNTDYGDNNYATNEPMTVALSIRYDNAIQSSFAVPGPGGIGSLNFRSTASSSTVGQNGIPLP
jgi:hypothetical protein